MPSDSGNITFTISSEDPRRSQQTFLRLPPAEELRRREARVFSDQERRLASDDLIYSFSTGNVDRSGSSMKLFEIGQILEFEDSDITEEVGLDVGPIFIDIQHNTNILDLAKLGLSNDEIEFIVEEASLQQKELETAYTNLQIDIAKFESDIVEIQKQINETNKVIGAVSNLAISDQSILDRLNQNLTILLDERLQKVDIVNIKKKDSGIIYNSILKISELVR